MQINYVVLVLIILIGIIAILIDNTPTDNNCLWKFSESDTPFQQNSAECAPTGIANHD